MKTMTVSKARNILYNKKLNYWDLYHAKYINSSDTIVAMWNTAEMYELEAEDYSDEYTEEEIQALRFLADYHQERGNYLASLERRPIKKILGIE